ncbi:MAG: transglycosylase domain-containing protein [Patescibacteria group bacterium]
MNSLKKIYKKLVKKRYLPLILILIVAILSYFLIFKDLPSPTGLNNPNNPQSSRIYDRNGILLYTIYSNKNRTQLPLEEIPKDVQNATIAIEDKDFYHHGAVDFRGIARAFVSTTINKQIQGGSTLTQQLVKSTLLSPEQTVKRKIKEIVLSFATETLYSKPQILTMYLNQIPYGGTAYGIEAGAQTYFGKNAKDLNLAESAVLAGLPQSPTLFSPFGAHPELAKERQELVLQRMREQGYITNDQEKKAKAEKLVYKNISNNIKAPHFVLYIKDLLEKKYGDRFVEQGGLTVKTTLDYDMQQFAELAVASEVAKLKFAHVTNGAAVVTDPAHGDILALVGSKDYFDASIDGNVNIALALRQPGSSIKPINYAAGFINGYNPATIFVDKEICFPASTGAAYCPKNYDGKFHGVVSLREALASSLNIPAVKMLKLNTVQSMIATASAMGISTFKDPQRYGLSLTLGGGEVTMLDMATAFGVFANKGYRVDLNPIVEVKSANEKIVDKKKPTSPIFGKRVLPEEVAFLISDILSDNQARSLAFGIASELVIPNQIVSAKTGTTNDYKDNWTIGYTPNYLVTSWVGNNDNTPMGGVVSGVTGAAPIWHEIMAHILQNKKTSVLKPPKNIIRIGICKQSGLLPVAGGTCDIKTEYFIKGKVPKNTDPGKTATWVDKTTKDIPKDPKQTDNLEAKDEYVVQDATGDKYCVSCPHPELSPSPTPNP